MSNNARDILMGGGCLAEKEPEAPATLPIRPKASKDHAATKLRFETYNAFTDNWLCTVSQSAGLVWYVLWRETQPNGHATVPHSVLAQRISRTRRTAIDATKELEGKGFLKVVHRGGQDKGANVYKVFGTPQT